MEGTTIPVCPSRSDIVHKGNIEDTFFWEF